MHWVVTAPSGARLRPIDPIRKTGLPAFLQHSTPDLNIPRASQPTPQLSNRKFLSLDSSIHHQGESFGAGGDSHGN